MIDTRLTSGGYATWRCQSCGGSEFNQKRSSPEVYGREEGDCTQCGWQPFIFVLDRFADEFLHNRLPRRPRR